MRHPVALTALAALVAAAASFGEASDILPLVVPRPQRCLVGGARLALPAEVVVVVGENATPMELYAAQMFARDLKTRLRWPGRIVTPRETGASRASVFLGCTSANPELWRLARRIVGNRVPSYTNRAIPGSYTLRRCLSGDRLALLIAGADPSGALYGSSTLLQLLERRGNSLALPDPLEVVDAPALETRAYTGSPRDVSEGSLATLDWLAWCRLNACYYEIYGDQGQNEVPPVIADLARECDRRGITLYGCVSNWRTELFLKRQLCASRQEDLQLIEGLFTQLAERGCRALIFLFDDLTQESVCHTETCADCKRVFGDLASTQVFWVRKMVEVGKRRKITRFLFCPTPYYRGWEKSYGGKLDGVAYYRRFAEAADLSGVQMYHCPFSAKEVTAVEKAGLRNFVWWQNGVYSLPALSEPLKALGLWGGFPQIAWGWYGTEWKAGRGLVTPPETLKELRTLPLRTRYAWLCNGGDLPWAVWGAYCWNPQEYDPETTERTLVDKLFGEGTYEPYARIEEQSRKWAYRFAGNAQSALGTGDNEPTRILADLETSAEEARQQLALFKERTEGQQSRPAILPEEKVKSYLKQLEGDVALLDRKLEQGKAGRTTVVAPPLSKQAEGQGFRFESKMTVSDFLTSYVLRYAIHEEPEGVYRRCQWHFGSGLGKTAPSYRNWYDAGFIDVEVDGKSLEACKASFTSVKGERGSERLVGRWDGATAMVTLTFDLSKSGALIIDGQVAPKQELHSLRVVLWCIPGAGWGEWKDMDKWLTTPTRDVQHDQRVKLDPAKEDWVLYYDKTYDVPRDKAEGPCAMMFVPSQVSDVEVDLAGYVVTTFLTYPRECRRFRLAVWDLHGMKNEEAVRYIKTAGQAMVKELRGSG